MSECGQNDDKMMSKWQAFIDFLEAVRDLEEQVRSSGDTGQDISGILRHAEDYLTQIKDMDFTEAETNIHDILE